MITLNIVLSSESVSFCNYQRKQTGEKQLMAFDDLKSGIQYAYKHNLDLNFIYDRVELPQEYTQLIEKTIHTKIIPSKYLPADEKAIMVFEQPEEVFDDDIPTVKTAILKYSTENMNALSKAAIKLLEHAERINIIKIPDGFDETALEQYRKQLEKIAGAVTEIYDKTRFGISKEINVLTDRLFLSKMNNCNAGLDHIALAPDGKYYPCPAFYFDEAIRENYVLDEHKQLPNQYLLEFAHAYICSECDCFHCQRCVYQNVKGTLELNTPTRIQCLISHTESEVSRKFRNRLLRKKIRIGDKIPKNEYPDPLDKILYANPFFTKKQKEAV